MSLAITICALVMGSQKGAPPDVPKNHWAYPAVDRMFQEGLLKGYPDGKHPALKLDKKTVLSLKEGTELRDRWRKMGLCPDNWSHGASNDPSRYELAVEVHVTLVTIHDVLKSPQSTDDQRRLAFNELPALVNAISAFNVELTKLGCDTGKMIETINDLLDGQARLFLGHRN